MSGSERARWREEKPRVQVTNRVARRGTIKNKEYRWRAACFVMTTSRTEQAGKEMLCSANGKIRVELERVESANNHGLHHGRCGRDRARCLG